MPASGGLSHLECERSRTELTASMGMKGRANTCVNLLERFDFHHADKHTDSW